jgi:hypothetical protein
VNVLGFVSLAHDVLSPAYFGMFAEITGRFGITSVKITTDHAAIRFSQATGCSALEDMYTALVDIYNGRSSLEEGIHR